MVSGSKTLQDQVGEVRRLISDASETLRQADWALETLETRLSDTRERSAPASTSYASPRASTAFIKPPTRTMNGDVVNAVDDQAIVDELASLLR